MKVVYLLTHYLLNRDQIFGHILFSDTVQTAQHPSDIKQNRATYTLYNQFSSCSSYIYIVVCARLPKDKP